MEAQELRRKARRFRELANRVFDELAQKALLELEDAYEKQAEQEVERQRPSSD